MALLVALTITLILPVFEIFCFAEIPRRLNLDSTSGGDFNDYGPWVWPFSIRQKQAIVDAHNEIRRNVFPEASDMMKMVWDEELALLAQNWSERCIFRHPTNIDYGQNLATHNDVMNAIKAWHSEHRDYNYENNTCHNYAKVCGHYKQLAWASSSQVGCGIYKCGDRDYITTCNYLPPGNYPGRSPYQNGHYCSECQKPGWCEDKLCNPSCKRENGSSCECYLLCKNCGLKMEDTCRCSCQPGLVGIDCTDICEDKHENCGNGWYPSLCDLPGWSFVPPRCPLMCGICEKGPYDPVRHCCNGKQCEQGLIDGRTCECQCHSGYGEEYECDEPTTEQAKSSGPTMDKTVSMEPTVGLGTPVTGGASRHFVAIEGPIMVAVVFCVVNTERYSVF
ncbi:cysteine-rich secretory protein 1-like [Ptychodera flava]|uniref:cysteine-rich secretory protein 1-like n=1 Tax=Ptychodera flava TaxID=63121 RepID=UPI00396A9CA0